MILLVKLQLIEIKPQTVNLVLLKTIKFGELITRDANNIHVREISLKKIQNILHTFGDHVHPHGITSAAAKPHV